MRAWFRATGGLTSVLYACDDGLGFGVPQRLVWTDQIDDQMHRDGPALTASRFSAQ